MNAFIHSFIHYYLLVLTSTRVLVLINSHIHPSPGGPDKQLPE